MLALFIFLLGISIGSFLNVVILRTQKKESWFGRSCCPHCQKQLLSRDLIPIFSFFFLKRQCRFCQTPISWQYPLVEYFTGFLFLFIFLKYTQGWFLSPMQIAFWGTFFLRDLIFILFLIVLFVYDLKYFFILDRFTIPGIVIALSFNVFLGFSFFSLLSGLVVLSGFFLLQFLFSKGTWVGGGDIRMGALMGSMLGLEQSLVALFLSYLIGALFGIALLLTKKATRKTQIPFGTFLAIGTFLVLFFGNQLIEWYLRMV